jgi:cytochrome c nitrite reductase small subunit
MKRISLVATFFGAMIGIAVGICGFTFTYAKGGSYLTNKPAACANCHVMQEQYDAWSKSSHHAVATCNDCHTPANVLGKYATKISNGFKHSYYFTVGGFPEPIRIAPGSLHITEQACRHCHQDLTSGIDAVHGAANLSCVRCHSSVGHLH